MPNVKKKKLASVTKNKLLKPNVINSKQLLYRLCRFTDKVMSFLEYKHTAYLYFNLDAVKPANVLSVGRLLKFEKNQNVLKRKNTSKTLFSKFQH